MLRIIPKSKIWLSFSGVLVGLCIIVLILFGLNFGIDFTGGSISEVSFTDQRPAVIETEEAIASMELGEIVVQPAGENSVLIRTKELSNEQHEELLKKLNEKFGELNEERYENIGPVIGVELKKKSLYAIIVVIICIILYVTYVFRKVSQQISSWKLGVSAIIALSHDIVIVTGIFALLGRFLDVEVGTLFVTALLMVLGYSVNDTIVVFDRVRENIVNQTASSFEENVNLSINQTITRSLNTSITTILVLLSLFFFGGESIKFFVLALILGVIVGTYSSIFVASPTLVLWQKLSRKK